MDDKRTSNPTIIKLDDDYDISDEVLHHIALGTAARSGNEFFSALVEHTAQALHADMVFVTECTTPDLLHVQTLAHWYKGTLAENFDYDLTPYPCTHVIQGNIYVHPSNLLASFPNEINGMESYIGVPLVGTTGTILGHLVVMNEHEIDEKPRGLSALRIFAARAAVELERLRSEKKLATSEERYRLLFDTNPLPIFVYDADTYEILAVNQSVMRIYGHTEAALKLMHFHDLVPESDRQQFTDWLKQPPEPDKPWECVFEHSIKSGKLLTVQLSRRSLRFEGRAAFLSVVHDMTTQRAAERERDAAYKNLEMRVIERTQQIDKRREVAESLRHLMTFLNQNGTVDEILDLILAQACELFGGCAGVICSLNNQHICTLHSTQNIEASTQLRLVDFPGWQQLLQMTETGQPITVIAAAGTEWNFAQASVKMPPIESLLALPLKIDDRVEYGLIIYYSQEQAFTQDDVQVALSFAMQSALAIESAHLRQRVRQIAIAEERSRLARDLHDSVTQQLYSLSLLVEGWRRLHQAGKLELSPDHLIEIGGIAQQSLKEMRLLIYELRPDTLDSEGLLDALHRRLNTVEERTGIRTRIIADTLINLPAPIENGLYRIAQEALNNVLKHARAEHVVIQLREAHGTISLEIRDDGRGFDLAAARDTGGIGLSSMQERALQIGATLKVESTPGVGTSIEVILPTQ
ncbi:MAG: hypothetical protein OHK0046_17640 [Anaerolineae bacterium]